jgi:hypothetical protein
VFKIILSLFVLLLSPFIRSQGSELAIGNQIPLIYTIGYEHKLKQPFSLNMQVGLLTKPYDKAILSTLKLFGTDEAIINTIGDAFTYGLCLQPTFKYHYKKNYFGVYYSYYNLNAKDAPIQAIESYYGFSIPTRTSRTERIFNLVSNLHNAGVMYGRRIAFKNLKLELRLEFAIAKTFASTSFLYGSSGFSNPTLNSLIDQKLGTYYLQYGYLPSFNVFFVYKFNAEKL